MVPVGGMVGGSHNASLPEERSARKGNGWVRKRQVDALLDSLVANTKSLIFESLDMLMEAARVMRFDSHCGRMGTQEKATRKMALLIRYGRSEA